jgi:hypothetical protein
MDDAELGPVSNTAFRPNSFARAVWALPLALSLFAIALYSAIRFPVLPIFLVAALIGYAAVIWREPRLWLFFVPALLPALNFAPRSGRFFFDELDLFLLITVATCALRRRIGRPVRLAPVAALLLGLFALIFIVSLGIGILPLEPLDANAFANYYSKYNGLRIGKSLLWAVVLLWLIRGDMGDNAQSLNTYWVPGMLAGLCGVVFIALWERLAFPGLTNFSEEYRVTSTFGSMHVGGGAIDGYLALALPFTLVWLSETKSLVKVSIAAMLLALGSYTVLATFSRGLYAACAVMVIALGFGAMVRQKTIGVFSVGRTLLMLVVILLFSGLLFSVFDHGGYRSLGAVLGLMALAFYLGRKGESRGGKMLGVLLAAGLIIASLIIIQLFAKGAYIAYAISFLVGVIGVAQSIARPGLSRRRLAWGGLLSTAFVTPFIGLHWGDSPALWACLGAVLTVMVVLLLNRTLKRPLWQPSLRHASGLAFVGLIFFVSIPIAGNSYFVGERFSEKSGGLNARVEHWRDALNMMDRGPIAQLFGMGIGRYPALYFWRSQRTSPPGTFTIGDELGNRFLRLGGTRDDLGGVTLYYAQRVTPEPYRVLTLSFDVRSTFPKSSVHAGLCESLLLYAENCETKTRAIAKIDGTWQRMEMQIDTKTLGQRRGLWKKPVQVWLVNPGGGTQIDIDNARLTDAVGGDLLRNGNFTQGGDHWLFSVSNFWPWHIESIWVHTLFEQGWLGLLLLIGLMLYAMLRLLKLVSQGQLVALAIFVSFAGFVTVGTFNSLFEFHRVGLLFYLILFIALLRWNDVKNRPHASRTHREVAEAA